MEEEEEEEKGAKSNPQRRRRKGNGIFLLPHLLLFFSIFLFLFLLSGKLGVGGMPFGWGGMGQLGTAKENCLSSCVHGGEGKEEEERWMHS